MNCVISINGRPAVPVRAILYITGGWIRPTEVAASFAMNGVFPHFLENLTAHHISPDGSIHTMLPKEWDRVERELASSTAHVKASERFEAASDSMSAEQANKLLPSHCFVWQDEFEESIRQYYHPRRITLIDERPGDQQLIFNPWISPEIISNVLEGFLDSQDAAPNRRSEDEAPTGLPPKYRKMLPREIDAALLAESESFSGRKKDFHDQKAREFGVSIERIRKRLQSARDLRKKSAGKAGVQTPAEQISALGKGRN